MEDLFLLQVVDLVAVLDKATQQVVQEIHLQLRLLKEIMVDRVQAKTLVDLVAVAQVGQVLAHQEIMVHRVELELHQV
jgi:uncharacterized protein (DUF2164 family)